MGFRNRYLLAIDALALTASLYLLYALRFENFGWRSAHFHSATIFAAFLLPIHIATYWGFGLYRRLWRYASIPELELIFVAGAIAWVLSAFAGAFLLPDLHVLATRVPLTVLFNGGVLGICTLATPRLLVRMRGRYASQRTLQGDVSRVLIAGAGAAAHMLLKEMRDNEHLGMYAVGFVDDDPRKQGLKLSNLPVFGALADTADIIRRERIDMLVVAMPAAPGSVVRPVVRAALDAGIQARTIPALSEIISGRVKVGALREVEIADLLRREPIETDLAGVATMITNRTVLVTGAGGSIGSELCRQIAQLHPKRLVMIGRGENPIFEILHELRPRHLDIDIVPVIADVRDRRRLNEIFALYRPHSVFHAAAHKHVPLMEQNVVEAVTNNVMGTRNVVEASVATDVAHFVFISTDKAVRPTNVMGASKRVAEHIVQAAAITHRKNFVAVRFGNVLGSRGSVVPTFVRQIREGGPVTVTHPEMRRYFMTIPEAVQLVLQAGALGRGGELFMLDMGEPVKVVDLARDLIRLSGLEEGEDIEIRFSGMRPGEKLYEEMFFSDELAERTHHPKVLRAKKASLEVWGAHLIAQLIDTATGGSCTEEDLRHMLHMIVPDFVSDPGAVSAPTPSFGVMASRLPPAPQKRASKPGAVLP